MKLKLMLEAGSRRITVDFLVGMVERATVGFKVEKPQVALFFLLSSLVESFGESLGEKTKRGYLTVTSCLSKARLDFDFAPQK